MEHHLKEIRQQLFAMINILNAEFELNEGCSINTYFYRIENDPDCIFGYPTISKAESNSLIATFIILRNNLTILNSI